MLLDWNIVLRASATGLDLERTSDSGYGLDDTSIDEATGQMEARQFRRLEVLNRENASIAARPYGMS